MATTSLKRAGFFRRAVCGSLAAGIMLACGSAAASGLQVSPVSLQMDASQKAEGLWLSNTGSSVVHAQVRIYRWTQNADGDRLDPTDALLASPPMLQITPGGRQLIRVVRVGHDREPNNVEASYRARIDELPIAAPGKGLQFVLSYSVPIFIASPSKPVTPALQWRVDRSGAQATLQVGNTGTGHAQVMDVSFTSASGKRTKVTGGLLGYVLPGATMRWAVRPPPSVFADGGMLMATINGAKVTQRIAPDGSSR